VAAQENSTFLLLGLAHIHYAREHGNCILQACAVAGAIRRAGRAEGSRLTKGQVAAENRIAGLHESVRQGAKQRCLGIASSPMGEYQAPAVRYLRRVQEPANLRIDLSIREIDTVCRIQAIILNGCCRFYLLDRSWKISRS